MVFARDEFCQISFDVNRQHANRATEILESFGAISVTIACADNQQIFGTLQSIDQILKNSGSFKF